MSVKKVGGIWFVRIGSIGFSFYRTRKPVAAKPQREVASICGGNLSF